MGSDGLDAFHGGGEVVYRLRLPSLLLLLLLLEMVHETVLTMPSPLLRQHTLLVVNALLEVVQAGGRQSIHKFLLDSGTGVQKIFEVIEVGAIVLADAFPHKFSFLRLVKKIKNKLNAWKTEDGVP